MPSGYVQDLSGEKFGRLTVIEKQMRGKRTYYLCKCNCENKTEKYIRADALTGGKTRSCGCYNLEVAKVTLLKSNTTHGLSRTKLYGIWGGMIARCENTKEETYKNYGGRGIKICKEWREDFLSFHKWSLENGFEEDKGLSIERVNVNGDYCPENCKWANQLEQANNKTTTIFVEINGETKPASVWDREKELPTGTVAQRLRNGKRGRDLIAPVRKRVERQSGHKNISWHTKFGKWRFGVSEKGKSKHIGYYDKLEDAIKAKENYLNKIN
jgi:hypothetical protein